MHLRMGQRAHRPLEIGSERRPDPIRAIAALDNGPSRL
jgi:hypothetical protein